MTAESSKDDEEWNTRVCNFVTAHGKRVFPYVSCANCIIPRESTKRRELYVHACVCDTTLQYRLHNFPRCSSSVCTARCGSLRIQHQQTCRRVCLWYFTCTHKFLRENVAKFLSPQKSSALPLCFNFNFRRSELFQFNFNF